MKCNEIVAPPQASRKSLIDVAKGERAAPAGHGRFCSDETASRNTRESESCLFHDNHYLLSVRIVL